MPLDFKSEVPSHTLLMVHVVEQIGLSMYWSEKKTKTGFCDKDHRKQFMSNSMT